MGDFTKLKNLFHANLSFPFRCPDASEGVRHLREKCDERNQWKHRCGAADKTSMLQGSVAGASAEGFTSALFDISFFCL